MKRLLFVALIVAFGCGGKKGGDGTPTDGNDTGDGSTTDGEIPGLDAPPFGGVCVPTSSQCSNCMDDDGDGFIDGADVECSGPFDNDEATFATGIPGDNKDAVNQDCFFDGNSGAGNDGCNIHVCCLLGATTKQECPIGANQFNPNECPPPIGTGTISQQCKDECGKLAPPGCDCFGCCTVCDPNTDPIQCVDIAVNPQTSPNCDATNILDPTKCLRCEKITDCGNSECGGTSCILCPGQTEDDLDPSCSGTAQCPDGILPCTPSSTGGICADQHFCANGDPTTGEGGCCIQVLQ
jgi:hypothetical protein